MAPRVLSPASPRGTRAGLWQRIRADVTPGALRGLSLGLGDKVIAVVKATQVALHPVGGGLDC